MPEARTAPTHPKTAGPYVAAFLAAGIGLLVLAFVQVLTELDDAFKERVFDLGKAWIPGAEGIGPYSGKETLMVVGWLGSWLVLHLALRHRDPDVRPWFGLALVMLGLAVLLLWPPVWHLLEGA